VGDFESGAVRVMAKIWKAGQKKETPEEKQARLAANEQHMALPYDLKVRMAKARVKDWQNVCWKYGKNYAVSVGGLDSITLLAFCREVLGEDVQGISISRLEDRSIQAVHREMGVIPVKPLKSKVQILQEYGFPVVSKLAAAKIERLQTPGDTSPIIRAYMTGDMGAWGGYRHNDRFKLPDKWVELFGGLYADMRPDLNCKCAPFKVSDQCCYWLKELPVQQYQEEHDIWPFLGLMQSEGGRRQYSLRMHGCNYVGETTARSCPFNYFNRQDLLRLALDLNVHVPEIYGEIVRDPDGTLRTTKAQRTGCSMCGFGIHLDQRPHHFDLLRESNPQEWEFWMYRCCTDPETGEKYGWGRVLDYIGVGWENDPYTDCVGQMDIFETARTAV
jgi:hypothetical protein